MSTFKLKFSVNENGLMAKEIQYRIATILEEISNRIEWRTMKKLQKVYDENGIEIGTFQLIERSGETK